MKFRSLLCLTAGISLFLSSPGSAQTRTDWCATDDYNAEMRRKNPALYQQRDLIEQKIIKETSFYGNSQNQKTSAAVKVIPVVVHVITENGTGGISDAQVLDGLRILNEDFRRLNPDSTQTRSIFQGVASDAEVEFRLAKLDPQGNCTNGINRAASIYTNGTQFSNRNIVKRAVQAWPTDKYFNVWLVNSISSPAAGGIILGFAQFPTPVLGPEYGVVIRHDQWGSIGTSNADGRTATHEVGHCLNLYHTFQSGCGSSCSNTGDLVCDTPPAGGQFGQPSYGCPTSLNSCSNDVGSGSPYTSDVVDQIENYMSYNDCQNMFTDGQKVRMDLSFNNYAGLQNLVSPANRVATGTNDGYVASLCTPISDFYASTTSVCEGGTITFTANPKNVDNTSNLQYTWDFDGATSPSLTNATEQVTYPNPGFYDVSLTTTNASGPNTATKSDYIRVVSVTNGETVPFTEGFEAPTFPQHPTDPAKNWITEISLDGANKWERTTNAAKTGNASIRLRNNTNVESTVSSIISPSYDFTNLISGALLSFDLAFAQRSTNDDDVLKVYISSDCGRTWQLRKTVSGSSLSTTGGTLVPSSFTPNNTQWRNEVINLSQFQRRNSVMFKIEFTSGGGNIAYIDNFMISGTVGLSENLNQQSIKVYPIPYTPTTAVELNLKKSQNIRMELIDVVGKLVYQEAETHYPSGSSTINFAQKVGKLNSGVYLLKIFTKDEVYQTKIIVH